MNRRQLADVVNRQVSFDELRDALEGDAAAPGSS